MATLMGRGMAFLARSLQRGAGVDLVYVRADDTADEITVDLVGWEGNAAQAAVVPTTPARIDYGVREYLFPAADLTYGGQPFEPRTGDRIRQVLNGETRTFELIAPPNEKCWRYADAGRSILRVHTKQVG